MVKYLSTIHFPLSLSPLSSPEKMSLNQSASIYIAFFYTVSSLMYMIFVHVDAIYLLLVFLRLEFRGSGKWCLSVCSSFFFGKKVVNLPSNRLGHAI